MVKGCVAKVALTHAKGEWPLIKLQIFGLCKQYS